MATWLQLGVLLLSAIAGLWSEDTPSPWIPVATFRVTGIVSAPPHLVAWNEKEVYISHDLGITWTTGVQLRSVDADNPDTPANAVIAGTRVIIRGSQGGLYDEKGASRLREFEVAQASQLVATASGLIGVQDAETGKSSFWQDGKRIGTLQTTIVVPLADGIVTKSDDRLLFVTKNDATLVRIAGTLKEPPAPSAPLTTLPSNQFLDARGRLWTWNPSNNSLTGTLYVASAPVIAVESYGLLDLGPKTWGVAVLHRSEGSVTDAGQDSYTVGLLGDHPSVDQDALRGLTSAFTLVVPFQGTAKWRKYYLAGEGGILAAKFEGALP